MRMCSAAMRFDTSPSTPARSRIPTTGAIMTPVYLTSTYVQDGPGEHKGYEYSRTRNPTRTALEACLAALEGAKFGASPSPPDWPPADCLIHLLDAGDHVVCSDDVLRRHVPALRQGVPPAGSELHLRRPVEAGNSRGGVHAADEDGVDRDAHQPDDEADRPGAAGRVCRARGSAQRLRQHLPLAVLPAPAGARGSTWCCTPPPSTSTATATRWAASWAPATRRSPSASASLQNAVGGVPSPMDSFLVLRGVKTLSVRMAAPRVERR